MSVLFIFFADKMNRGKIYAIVKNQNWYNACIAQLHEYFKSNFASDSKLKVKCKYSQKDDEDDYQYRCKSLATIYNYFRICDSEVSITNMDEVLAYISTCKYTTEHFILNKSKKCKVNSNSGEMIIEYPKEINKYIQSMFNFIFTSKSINGEILGDYCISQKIEIMEEELEKKDICCEYSKMVLKKIKKHIKFPDFSDIASKEEADRKVKEYYLMDFREEYATYVGDLVDELYKTFTSKKSSPK